MKRKFLHVSFGASYQSFNTLGDYWLFRVTLCSVFGDTIPVIYTLSHSYSLSTLGYGLLDISSMACRIVDIAAITYNKFSVQILYYHVHHLSILHTFNLSYNQSFLWSRL